MAQDTAITDPIVAPIQSPETGKPADVAPEVTPDDEIDHQYWERCLADAERAERDWRSRGREIIKLYRNDGQYTALGKRKAKDETVFNILYSNTEVMLPAIFAQPPEPVVRSRFTKKSAPPEPIMPPMPPPGMAPPGMPPPMPPEGLSPEGAAPMPPPDAGMGAGVPPPPPASPPTMPEAGGAPVIPFPPQPGMPPAPPLGIMPPQPLPMPDGMPAQQDIETAAAVMEKALEIVLDDDESFEATKAAVKDVLLPGRGTVRVRWKPQLQEQNIPDPVMGGDLTLPGAPIGAPPLTEMVKVWETVNDEYVYWEDVLYDPVRQFADGAWIAYRHLFDEQAIQDEFPDSPELQKLIQAGKISEILKWTEESAAKHAVGGGSAMKTAEKLGDVIKKAMVWEIWDKRKRRIIWFIREVAGITLRVDPDSLGLSNFYPSPKPLLAVTTTDTMLPRPYYDLYAHLAEDLNETSRRISSLTEKIKVRGGYNSANRDIAGLLTAEDGKMLPVDGVDLMSGGLQNHIWLVPLVEWMNALKELYLAREQIKQAIYEVMGISDIMRGATNPHETATAQRIKGSMGVGRLGEQKQNVANFVRDLLRMKAQIIAKNFDAETLTRMTGEEVTPEVMEILRDDFDRTCSIDIETDSTVTIDETMEQESNAKIMMAVQGVVQGIPPLIQTGVLPPPMVIQMSLELIKMLIQPIRNSRGVVELINDFQETLSAQIQSPMPMAMPPGTPMPGAPPGAEQMPPQGAVG